MWKFVIFEIKLPYFVGAVPSLLCLKLNDYFTTVLPGDRYYVPTRMQQGHTDASAHFACQMRQKALKGMDANTLVYGDDIVIHASTLTSFTSTLGKVLERFRRYRLRISAKKSKFCCQKFSWCGRIFENGKYSYEPMADISSFRSPVTIKELSQLVHGLTWRAMELPHFAQIIHPFRTLLSNQPERKSAKIVGWTEEDTERFKKLKQAIKDRCGLQIYNTTTQYPVLTTDASDQFWSSCLWACDKKDRHLPIEKRRMNPICFLSGEFTGPARRWGILDKEAYPIVRTFQRHNWMLADTNPDILTDNKNLNYIFNPESYLKDNSATIGRVSRWAQYLSRYRFNIRHISGERNVWADMLTRHTGTAVVALLETSITSEELRQTVRKYQKRDFPAWKQHYPKYTCDPEQDIYTYNGKIVIPDNKELITLVISEAHVQCLHFKTEATLALLHKNFHFLTNVKPAVEKLIKQCRPCQLTNRVNPRHTVLGAMPQENIVPNGIIHTDFLYIAATTFPYVLVIKDDLSGYLQLSCHRTNDSNAVMQALSDWAGHFGTPRMLVSDRGSHFTDVVLGKLTKQLQVKHHFTSAYSPKSNGVIERANRDVLNAIRTFTYDSKLPQHEYNKC